MSIELTDRGYLVLPREVVEEYFPTDSIIALLRGDELWLLPVKNSASGGLLMKYRNGRGDRSVFIEEVLRGRQLCGKFPHRWQQEEAALIVDLAASSIS